MRLGRVPLAVLLGLAAWLGACGEKGSPPSQGAPQAASGSAPSSSSGPAPARALEPAEMVAALASRRVAPLGVDSPLDHWRDLLVLALRASRLETSSVSVRAWKKPVAGGPSARLWGAEVRLGSDGAGAPTLHLTACAADPALAAAEELAYLTEMEGGGHFVQAIDFEGLKAFESNWNFPASTIVAWHHGELVVRAFGLDEAQRTRLHAALAQQGLYGPSVRTVPRRPDRPAPKEEPAAPPERDPGVPAPPPSAPWTPPKSTTPTEDGPNLFVARWRGTVDGAELTLDIDIQNGFKVVHGQGAKRETGSGYWDKTATGITLTTTHENGKRSSKPDRAFARIVGKRLELRERADGDVLAVLDRVP